MNQVALRRTKDLHIRLHLRDPLAGLIHCAAAGLSIWLLVLLLLESGRLSKPWHMVSFSIYGAGLILLYLASTLCHWLPVSQKIEQRLEKFDFMMIFVLIAATYTPVCLIPLRGGWGWSMFGVVWGLALAGIALQVVRTKPPKWATAAIYVAMGWTFLVGIVPICTTLQAGALFWLFLGGFFYTLGGLVYAVERPDPWPKIFGFHEIFHILVVGGSFSHFWMMYAYIMEF